MSPFDYLSDLGQRYPQLNPHTHAIQEAVQLMVTTFRQGCKMLTAGNGGSASDAEHISGELLKSFKKPQHPKDLPSNLAIHLQCALPVIPLGSLQAAYTAFSNDCDPQWAFAQLVYALGRKGDTLLAISTSGRSKNICYAAEVAKAKHMTVIGLSGNTGGDLKALCDVCICVPETETYKIQEFHLAIYHTLCLIIEERMDSMTIV